MKYNILSLFFTNAKCSIVANHQRLSLVYSEKNYLRTLKWELLTKHKRGIKLIDFDGKRAIFRIVIVDTTKITVVK